MFINLFTSIMMYYLLPNDGLNQVYYYNFKVVEE